MSVNSIDMLPDQCKDCIKLEICLDNDCIKSKPCLQRLEPKPIDVDLLNEMKERMHL